MSGLFGLVLWVTIVVFVNIVRRASREEFKQISKKRQVHNFETHPEPTAIAQVFGEHISANEEHLNYIELDADYDEHPDVDSILNTRRKCPFCGAYVRDNEAVCHKCKHEI